MKEESFEEYYNRRLKEEWKYCYIGLGLATVIWIVGCIIGYTLLK